MYIPNVAEHHNIVKIVGATRPMLVITEDSGPSKSHFNALNGLLYVISLSDVLQMAQNMEDLNEVFPLETLTYPCNRTACIFHTPGTMDLPLSVRIGHREVLNRCLWQYKEFPYRGNEIASMSSILEDVECLPELFAPILAGVPLYLLPRKVLANPESLMMKIRDVKITRIGLGPPIFAELLKAYSELRFEEKIKEPLRTIKYWTVCGDALSYSFVEKFIVLLSQYQTSLFSSTKDHRDSSIFTSPVLIHSYSATEVTNDVTFETFEDQSDLDNKGVDGKVSIGRPIANTIIYIVDADMKIVDEGVIGEICVAGACVASGGYVFGTDRDDMDRFCVNPFTKKKGFTTMYQTEDFGRLLRNKEGVLQLYYEGRTEFIAKVSGKQVDLRDLARAVSNTELVQECSVLCYRSGKEDQAIVAFCRLKQNMTPKEVEKKLRLEMTDEDFIPRIFPLEKFYYLPSGRLDKNRLFKQFRYETLNVSPEEWEKLNLPYWEKSAAKVFFAAIALYTGQTKLDVIEKRSSPMWSMGVDSLNAFSIFFKLRDNGFIIDVDDFLNPKSDLLTLLQQMRSKHKSSGKDYSQQQKLLKLGEMEYTTRIMLQTDKPRVLHILGSCYSKKNAIARYAGLTETDISLTLDSNWRRMIKDGVSIVSVKKSRPSVIVGVLIAMDAHAKFKLPPKCPLTLKHVQELADYSEKASKEHVVWKQKGSVSQIHCMGTSSSESSLSNILIVGQLMRAHMQRAQNLGYTGSMLTCVNQLARDMCDGIFYHKLLEEVFIHKFQAKDKTRPFRLAAEYQKLKVFYDRF